MNLFFDYELPHRLIAQYPAQRRDESRLLVVRRSTGEIAHHIFRDVPALLAAGDRLVLNDTRVLPARLIGQRVKTGGKWEALFLHEHADGTWEVLAQTRGFAELGEAFTTDTGLTLTLTGRTEERHWLLRPQEAGTPAELLSRYGEIPLPPYIRKGRADPEDRDRYQTIYAEGAGSVAAPTAGLHFTPEVLRELATSGVSTSRVTLHVGLGTFAPVKVENPTEHAIHAEWCEVNEPTVQEIQSTKQAGGRIIAVGTTTTRTLETAAQRGKLCAFRGESKLYIYPPYSFRVVDGLITNFHLPRTTLLLLVQALTGPELLQKAYEEAIAKEYRFFSYGDAMLIV